MQVLNFNLLSYQNSKEPPWILMENLECYEVIASRKKYIKLNLLKLILLGHISMGHSDFIQIYTNVSKGDTGTR